MKTNFKKAKNALMFFWVFCVIMAIYLWLPNKSLAAFLKPYTVRLIPSQSSVVDGETINFQAVIVSNLTGDIVENDQISAVQWRWHYELYSPYPPYNSTKPYPGPSGNTSFNPTHSGNKWILQKFFDCGENSRDWSSTACLGLPDTIPNILPISENEDSGYTTPLVHSYTELETALFNDDNHSEFTYQVDWPAKNKNNYQFNISAEVRFNADTGSGGAEWDVSQPSQVNLINKQNGICGLSLNVFPANPYITAGDEQVFQVSLSQKDEAGNVERDVLINGAVVWLLIGAKGLGEGGKKIEDVSTVQCVDSKNCSSIKIKATNVGLPGYEFAIIPRLDFGIIQCLSGDEANNWAEIEKSIDWKYDNCSSAGGCVRYEDPDYKQGNNLPI